MANIVEIKQYKGPFGTDPITINANCKIGVSIGQEDFMKFGSVYNEQKKQYEKLKDFFVNINGQLIQIGRTFRYETDEITNVQSVSFPDGAPLSTIVQVVTYS